MLDLQADPDVPGTIWPYKHLVPFAAFFVALLVCNNFMFP